MNAEETDSVRLPDVCVSHGITWRLVERTGTAAVYQDGLGGYEVFRI